MAKPRTLLDSLVPAPPEIHFKWGSPAGLEQDASFTAGVDPASRTIYHTQTLDRLAGAHEVGHLLDAEVLNAGDRAYFTRILGLTGPWNQGTGLTAGGLRSPNEWFADYYSAAANHFQPGRDGMSAYAQIGPVRLQRFEKALGRLGQRRGLQPLSLVDVLASAR